MSLASKLTLGFSLVFTIGTTAGVFYLQQVERDALKQGPIKDAKRVDDYNSKQKANLLDFELQKKLRLELSKDQDLTGDVVKGDDDEVSK